MSHEMTAAAVSAIPWANIFSEVKILLAQYGPQAIPFVETYLAGLGLPAWVLPVIDGVIEMILGQPAAKLDGAKCCPAPV